MYTTYKVNHNETKQTSNNNNNNTWVSKSWYESGQLSHTGFYTNGVMTGTWQWFHTNGKPYIIGTYNSNGKQTGTWIKHDDKGNITHKVQYSNGVKHLVSTS